MATEAKFSINLDSNAGEVSDEMANALEGFRQQIEQGQAKIKEYASALRNLRGSSEEVKTAKQQLIAKLNAERDAVSRASLSILKAGTTYDRLSAKTKALAANQERLKAQTKSMSSAVSAAGGPASALKDKVNSLHEILGGAGGAMGAVAFGAAALAAAILAVAAASVAGIISLAKWIIVAANAARTANLFREAASGSASNAYALGTQVAALAEKVPTARAALNDLAISLAKGGIQGQTLVDTLNAVGQASAALGDDAGAKLREFIDRGRLTQRFMVNPLELQGTGLQFDDIAKSLAKNMKVGIGQARQALFEGRVKLADGAKAMRDAVEQKFGGINLRRMLDLNVIAEKFKEKLTSLTSGVDIEPFLRGLQKLTTLFDESTFTGTALKTLITLFGNTLSTTFEKSVPYMMAFFKGMVIAGLDVAIAFFRVKNALTSAFGDSAILKNVDGMSFALKAGKLALYGIGAALLMTAGFVAVAAAPFVALGASIALAMNTAYEAVSFAYDLIAGIKWSDLGKSIVNGLVAGIKSIPIVKVITELGDQIKTGFKASLGIHSPSKVFAEFGRQTTEGYAKGVDSGSDNAQGAVTAMVAPPAARGGAAQSITISLGGIHVTVTGGGDAKAIAKAVSEAGDSILAQIVEALGRANASGGVPA